MSPLYLIDASNWVYAAWHAVKGDLTVPLTSMVDGLLRRARPEPGQVTACWDGDAPSWRADLWPEYKARRDRGRLTPDDWARAREIVESRGIRCVDPVLDAEADDMIASLAMAAIAGDKTSRVLILSSDRDFWQLLSRRVYVGTRRGGKAVQHSGLRWPHFGEIPPFRMPDVLALAGKPDCVPGIPKIGIKGAIHLVSTFGDLETLLGRLGEVRLNSYRTALEEHRDTALLGLRLARLRTDLPLL